MTCLLSDNIGKDKGLSKLSPEACALFFLILGNLNPHGKMDGDPFTIKGKCCRHVEYITIENLPALLQEITQHTSMKWFEDQEGNYWIHALKHGKYNRLDRLGKDKLPSYLECPKDDSSGNTPGEHLERSRPSPPPFPPEGEGKGEGEAKGEAEGKEEAESEDERQATSDRPTDRSTDGETPLELVLGYWGAIENVSSPGQDDELATGLEQLVHVHRDEAVVTAIHAVFRQKDPPRTPNRLFKDLHKQIPRQEAGDGECPVDLEPTAPGQPGDDPGSNLTRTMTVVHCGSGVRRALESPPGIPDFE